MGFSKHHSTVPLPLVLGSNRHVVLDACVLVNISLCDILLRLTEPPSLFEPKWSEEIISETVRALESKLGWSTKQTAYLQQELALHVGRAWVEEYRQLIPNLKNDSKDRHVLAAAIQSQSSTILTFNLKHFCPEHLETWGVIAIHPDVFLIDLYRQAPELILEKLRQQASKRNRSLPQLLTVLDHVVPEFASAIRACEE